MLLEKKAAAKHSARGFPVEFAGKAQDTGSPGRAVSTGKTEKTGRVEER